MTFYENRNTFMYKVIGAVICTIIDEYICLYYLGLLQEKLSKHNDNFKKTKFKILSGLVIRDIFMNIVSCHGFIKSSMPKVILTGCNAIVMYYLSKVFFIV